MIIESADIVKSPTISVIVITYNQERYISQCLDAILSQKVNVPYELIIAEDAGTDGTREICKRYQKEHPDIIRLLLQDKNRGLSGNYADVLSLTRGKYIAQIAGDDFWILDTKLQLQKDYLDTHPKCGLCFTNTNTCDEQGEMIGERYLNKEKISKSFEEHLLSKGYIAPLTWMYRREMVSRYDIKGAFTDESFAFALDIFAVSEVHYIDIVSAMYRVANGSLSHPTSYAKWYKQYIGVFKAQLYYCDKYNVSEALRNKVLINGYIYLLPYATACEENAFIQEAVNNCKKLGIDMQPYIELCNQKNNLEVTLRQIRQSYAYRLGKKILSPLKFLKSIKK